ncbi:MULTISPECIES: selenide, water dikinase SelD [Moorena]|nr:MULTISPECIES: selenide, water dikinase SelD [Moorena]NEP67902.1 selenide, water dikinase SelD [Moorena sp. SIO3A5]NEQ06584.1 selenide, water dikinase SelD [Moorena sp. SIO4E2]NEQ14280.1 selenide, water dikinase SelD [Moorena sp. SIO3E2]OLT69582.1 selenide, water dikinase SelD [Moorena producens 3L]
MQAAPQPITTDLVLVGGGHSHAIALKKFAMKPLPGVRITLITDNAHTPYSGMLPGHVAGFYSYDEAHIDLRRLAVFSKAQLYLDQGIGLELTEKKVICANHPPVAFDYLSIDIGSTPATVGTPGAAKYSIPAKPVPLFLAAWEQIAAQVEQNPMDPFTLGIVGGGAGGVELALNMQAKLHGILTDAGQPTEKLQVHLFHRGTQLLPQHNRSVSRHLEKIFLQRGIRLHLGERVSEIAANGDDHPLGACPSYTNISSESILLPGNTENEQDAPSTNLQKWVICDSGLKIACHHVFWVTQASAPSWIKASGLATDERGFVLVADTLQSISHPHVFATGDIATMQNYQRPKAGVFAVRQGKPLFENLRRIVLGQKLLPYHPQARYLSLIGTGDKQAIASWSFLEWRSPLLWLWKDQIDRKFMDKFDDLPSMEAEQPSSRGDQESQRQEDNLSSSLLPSPISKPKMHCAGCGSKVGSTILEKVIKRLPIMGGADIMIGLGDPDDAAVLQVPAGQLLVQTVDYFRSLIDDPYIFGQVASNHCLSDIFAMGATPQSALAIVTIPYGTDEKIEETLYQLMSGANKILQDCQSPLIGGHTTEGAELAFGLSCNGLVHPNQLLRKSGMKPGQVLILTKAIGTGTLFAADMRYQAKGRWIEQALESMLLSNQTAAQVLLESGATACTDITGFGLFGHLFEMVKASQVGVELDLDTIPILPGAIETVQAGITSSLHPQNLRLAIYINNATQASDLAKYQLLFDPQTSGGLLAAIPAENLDECIKKLKTFGHKQSSLIGRVIPAPESMPITLNIG